jgi:hypothetical protein
MGYAFAYSKSRRLSGLMTALVNVDGRRYAMSEVLTEDATFRDKSWSEAARLTWGDSALMVAIRRRQREIENSEVVTVGHDAII